jgi:DNA repair exonuclease SbcCD ATPase subunit
LVVLLASIAYAQEEIPPYEGWLGPDNLFYGLKVALQNLEEKEAATAEEKIAKQLEHAEERIAEAKAMAKKGKEWAVERAMKEYRKKAEEINETAAEVEEKGIENAIQRLKKHQEVLQNLINETGMPEQCKDALRRALENSRKAEDALEKAKVAREKAKEKIPEETPVPEEKIPEETPVPEEKIPGRQKGRPE